MLHLETHNINSYWKNNNIKLNYLSSILVLIATGVLLFFQ